MKEVNPQETTRAYAFEMWLKAPNPMVTFIKTLDITRIVKVSRRRRLKFNMLLDWCIGKAAASVKEFYLLPVGGKLIQYDSIAVNTIVKNKTGEVSSCDILFHDHLSDFNSEYLKYTAQVAETCQDRDLSDSRFALPVINEDGEIERYNVYQAVLIVRCASDEKLYLYDVQNIKKEACNPS